jgi:hypothetical protein
MLQLEPGKEMLNLANSEEERNFYFKWAVSVFLFRIHTHPKWLGRSFKSGMAEVI